MSADPFQELRRHDAIEQLSDDVFQRLFTLKVVNQAEDVPF